MQGVLNSGISFKIFGSFIEFISIYLNLISLKNIKNGNRSVLPLDYFMAFIHFMINFMLSVNSLIPDLNSFFFNLMATCWMVLENNFSLPSDQRFQSVHNPHTNDWSLKVKEEKCLKNFPQLFHHFISISSGTLSSAKR